VDPNSELFRAKQQVIYYKAEIAKYKNKISELEKLVEKEVVRNKYLQGKIRELNGGKIAGYIEEIQGLRKKILKLEVELEEESTHFPSSNFKDEQIGLYSYFNYSVILPQKEESTISIYGTYNIVNEGEFPIDDMVVCLKIIPVGAFTFSAKISDPKLLNGSWNEREDIEWVYAVNDWREQILKKGICWIKNLKLINESILLRISFELLLDNTILPKSKLEAEIHTKQKIIKSINNIVIQY
jgi:uncharacterized protein YdcH (DUF465 family)